MNKDFISLLAKCNTPKEMSIATEGAFTAGMSEGEIISNLIQAYYFEKEKAILNQKSEQLFCLAGRRRSCRPEFVNLFTNEKFGNERL